MEGTTVKKSREPGSANPQSNPSPKTRKSDSYQSKLRQILADLWGDPPPFVTTQQQPSGFLTKTRSRLIKLLRRKA